MPCEITQNDMQLARGLGLIHRGRRTAWAYLAGKLQRVYRTSRMVLTLMGRMLLGLGARKKEYDEERRAISKKQKNQTKDSLNSERTRIEEHIQGQSDDGGGRPKEVTSPNHDVGKRWLKEIVEKL